MSGTIVSVDTPAPIIRKKMFLTTIEIAFVFENRYNYVVDDIEYFFNMDSLNENTVKPLIIKIKTSTGQIKTYTYENIIIDIGYIPMYKLSCSLKGAGTYYKIKYNNNIAAVDNRKLSSLQRYSNDAFEYEIKTGQRTTDIQLLNDVKKMLDDNGFEYSIEENGDVVHGININSDTLITFTGLVSKSYCIKPMLGKYGNYDCIGRFIYKNGKYIKGPIDEHLALIVQCPKCHKKIIADYWNYKGNKCECGTDLKW